MSGSRLGLAFRQDSGVVSYCHQSIAFGFLGWQWGLAGIKSVCEDRMEALLSTVIVLLNTRTSRTLAHYRMKMSTILELRKSSRVLTVPYRSRVSQQNSVALSARTLRPQRDKDRARQGNWSQAQRGQKLWVLTSRLVVNLVGDSLTKGKPRCNSKWASRQGGSRLSSKRGIR